jgi:hypothetical protein
MELHRENRQLGMDDPLHDAIFTRRGDTQLLGKRSRRYAQRVIPGSIERRGYACKHVLTAVRDARRLAVHEVRRINHIRAVCVSDRLQSEADAK